MASINNNSARKYSIAVRISGETRILKVMPGLNVDLNDEEVVAASRLKYVQTLQDNGTFVVNASPTIAPAEPTPEPEEAPEPTPEPEEAPEPTPEPEDKPKKKRKSKAKKKPGKF